MDKLLKLLFRAEFIDDYNALKPLMNFKELYQLISLNEPILDPVKVAQFMKRYNAEPPASPDGK